jgi:sugar lactone lactonase YvrE
MNRRISVFVWCAVLLAGVAYGQADVSDFVAFDSDLWELADAETTTYLGRNCISGTAYLKHVEFHNGVIEVDVVVDGSRSYPGVVFRVQSETDYERFYLRPHRAGFYPDALQYTPVINGIAGWQLYHGKGFTAGAQIPENEWIRLRLEVKGAQTRVFVGDAERPGLVVDALKHGDSRGPIGIMSDGPARFSNFRYELTDDLDFDEPRQRPTPGGTITDWELSRSFKTTRVDPARYPRFFTIFGARWQKVTSEPSGLVDVARFVERRGSGADCVLARKIVQCDSRRDVRLSFGYSDKVTVFLNGHRVFTGNSAYRSRDRSFMGVVGLHDAVYLPLEKGRNEIMLIVTEQFGGWGFMAHVDEELAEPSEQQGRMIKVWETADVFKVPESVLYDRKRDILYVSSFDKLKRKNVNTGFISKVTLDGEIDELEWVTGLDGPCGMGLHKNRLYVVECSGNLVEIDARKGEVQSRYKIEGSTFLNDLAIDRSGNVYISDTSRERAGDDIYRFKKGTIEVWKTGDEIHRANGLFIYDERLIIGNTGDGFLKSIDLGDKRVERITCLGAGVIDGIRVNNNGNYIISHWEGQTYEVTPDGSVTKIFDTMTDGLNAADFEFVTEKNLLVVPTFLGNKVVAYRVVD